jgi:tight adherence protein B
VFGLVGAVLFGAVPWFVLAVGVSRRSKKLHAQLPDVLMMLSSSLRAGHGFMQALDTVAQEVGDPMASELSRVVAEVRLGRRPDDAMSSMGERVDSDDFRWAAMAVNIQREAGGNLAEILDTVAETVRERDQVRRQIEVLSAEGRLSMWILGSLPFLIAAYIAKVNPSYLKLLFTSKIGVLLTAGAAVLLVTGIFWLRKIVKIDV